MKDIIIIGCGGHAKSIVDIIEQNEEYKIVGFVDCNMDDNKMYRGYKIIGTDSQLKELYDKGIRYAAIGIGYLGTGELRDKVYSELKSNGFYIPSFVDHSAVLATDAQIGEGTIVGKMAIVNSAAIVGKMSIINSGAIIEHDCEIGDYTHIAIGARLCGDVKVGHHSFVGAGTTVIQGTKIGNECIIGANSTVLRDVPNLKKVYGIVK